MKDTTPKMEEKVREIIHQKPQKKSFKWQALCLRFQDSLSPGYFKRES
jgi:hypothetical protein